MSPTCTHCHTPLQDNVTFCRNCGTLTGSDGLDPTLIIRRPSPDASSPWAKIGARFETGSSNPSNTTTAPITVGAFVTQVPSVDSALHAHRPLLSDRVPPSTDEAYENNAERTRIVRKQAGLPILKGWLVAIDGPEKGESWSIRTGKNSIGRTPGVDVLLREDSISSSHAVLWLGENESATLVDRDSSNGTFVDAQQVFQPTELADDALIRCGEKTTLQWVRYHPRLLSKATS